MEKRGAKGKNNTAQRAGGKAGKNGLWQAHLRPLRDGVRAKRGLNWLVAALAALILPLVYQTLIEFVRVRSTTVTLQYMLNRHAQLIPGWAVLTAAFLCLKLASRRPWVANLALGLVCLLAGYANFYKLAYRGDPVLPRDLVQWREGAIMAGEMHLGMTRETWIFLLFVLFSTAFLLPFRVEFLGGWKGIATRTGSAVLCAVFVPAFVVGYIGNRDMMDRRHNVSIRNNTMATSYYLNSFVTSFLYLTASMRVEAPPDYSPGTVAALAAEVAATGQGEKEPDIIVVLLESFFDLTQMEGTGYSEDILANYNRLAAEGLAGTMVVDKRSGGTAGYEFSVLTGFSLETLPSGAVPYIEYMYQDFPSAPLYYKQQGYEVLAIHPYMAAFYGRSAAYKQMGFDEFLHEEHFEEGDRLGDFVSDEALGRRVIAEYEARTADGTSVFMNVVTMQGHTPHTLERYPEGYGVLASAGQEGALAAQYDDALSGYATDVRDMDRMIGMLCDYFAGVDRDVVLLFFGDHQTAMTGEGEYEDLYYLTPGYQNAEGIGQWLMTHSTPYLMWANYATVEGDGPTLASHLLLPVLADTFDVNAPAWLRWQGTTTGLLGGQVNGFILGPDGSLQGAATAEQQAVLDAMALLQYDSMFGRQYAWEELFD